MVHSAALRYLTGWQIAEENINSSRSSKAKEEYTSFFTIKSIYSTMSQICFEHTANLAEGFEILRVAVGSHQQYKT